MQSGRRVLFFVGSHVTFHHIARTLSRQDVRLANMIHEQKVVLGQCEGREELIAAKV